MRLRLRHLVELGPRPKMALPDDLEVSFAPMDSIKDGLGGLYALETKPAAEVASGSYNYFENGDVLLAKVTPCFENGKKALASGLQNGAGFATSEVHVIRPKPGRIVPRFLLYLLSSEKFRAEGMASMTGAGGLRRVSELAILNHRLAVTDLPTQKAIADFLDRETARIHLLIEKKQRLVALLRERNASAVEAAITTGHPMTKLGHHVCVLPGFAFSSSEFSEDDADIRLLRGTNVNPGKINWQDAVFWPQALANGLDRFRLAAGDVVMGMDRPWVSEGIRVVEITEEDTPCLLLQRVCKIVPRDTLTKDFLLLLLMSRRFLGYFEPELTGVSVPHISGDQICRFRFGYVDVTEQENRASACKQILKDNQRLIDKSALSIERLREFRAALITAAVTGQIDAETWSRRGTTDRRLDQIEAEMGA